MNAESKAMKSEMQKAAEGRIARMFPGLSKAKRCALARKGVDMYVAKVRSDVRKGLAYVETNGG